MRVEMIQDEFDTYFARAAIGRDVDYTPASPAPYIKEHESVTRRGSVPSETLKAPEPSGGVRRTRSCKYPARRRRDRSTSPRDTSVSPKTSSRRESVSGDSSSTLTPADSYIHETTLRAPSPNTAVKCHSAPHSRSSSWKKSKKKELELEIEPRPRTGSVPLEDTLSQLEKLKLLQQEEGLFPVRNFCMSPKGLINRGDSFKRRSNQSVASEGAVSGGSAPEGSSRSRALSVNSQGSGSDNTPVCRVLMMGDHGVGKTALLHQFMTSEYMGATDTSFDDENDITISVLLNGDETTLEFMDVHAHESIREHGDIDAFVLVYSITDRDSFDHVIERLGEIRRDVGSNVAVIVVANKSDLVRTRQVSDEEAREMCMSYDTKFIEVSAVLNHRVDDLLVGIVTQIRLYHRRFHATRPKPEPVEKQPRGGGGSDCVPRAAKGLIDKFFRKQTNVSRSCDDLLAL